MSKAVAGKQYIFQDGDTLQSIAAQAYGDSTLWTRISKANQSKFKSAGPAPGDVLNIPTLSENNTFRSDFAALLLIDKEPDELTILVDGVPLVTTDVTIVKNIDTGADAWSATIDWQPGENKTLDRLLRPFAYTPAAVYIGNELVINGLIYEVQNTLNKIQSSKKLYGYSFTADLVDSNLKPPYEAYQVTLHDRAVQIVSAYGLDVIYDVEDDEFFDRVTAGSTEKIFAHLAKLASQRGLLVTSTEKGDVLFTRAKSGKSVGTLREGAPGVLNWDFTFKGRSRFNAYKAIGQSPFGAKDGIAIDDRVPRPRFMTFKANDTTVGNIQEAADWRRNKQIADSLSSKIPVVGWHAPDGTLWKKNTLVTIISAAMEVPEGFNFLIRGVTFTLDNNGRSATLDVVPPQVYTGEATDEPW
jgi:prophage tail gpP-like protein